MEYYVMPQRSWGEVEERWSDADYERQDAMECFVGQLPKQTVKWMNHEIYVIYTLLSKVRILFII